jgi:hypothetical protein
MRFVFTNLTHSCLGEGPTLIVGPQPGLVPLDASTGLRQPRTVSVLVSKSRKAMLRRALRLATVVSLIGNN